MKGEFLPNTSVPLHPTPSSFFHPGYLLTLQSAQVLPPVLSPISLPLHFLPSLYLLLRLSSSLFSLLLSLLPPPVSCLANLVKCLSSCPLSCLLSIVSNLPSVSCHSSLIPISLPFLSYRSPFIEGLYLLKVLLLNATLKSPRLLHFARLSF